MRKASLVRETFAGQQMFRMLNHTLRYETAVSGKLPAIPSGFVTFPTGSDIDASVEMTLHRYANHSVKAPLRAFVVTALTQDSGYGVLKKPTPTPMSLRPPTVPAVWCSSPRSPNTRPPPIPRSSSTAGRPATSTTACQRAASRPLPSGRCGPGRWRTPASQWKTPTRSWRACSSQAGVRR